MVKCHSTEEFQREDLPVALKNEFQIVNLSQIESIDSPEISPSILKKFGIIKYSLRPVKILAHGELSKKVNIVASAFSKSAIEKIEKNGGKAIQN